MDTYRTKIGNFLSLITPQITTQNHIDGNCSPQQQQYPRKACIKKPSFCDSVYNFLPLIPYQVQPHARQESRSYDHPDFLGQREKQKRKNHQYIPAVQHGIYSHKKEVDKSGIRIQIGKGPQVGRNGGNHDSGNRNIFPRHTFHHSSTDLKDTI